MRIATWNIERLDHKSKLNEIISVCQKVDADILVLTETDERVKLDNYQHLYATEPPDGHIEPNADPIHYNETETRVMIYTKYPVDGQFISTYDNSTARCIKVKTDSGDLLIYGCIIGILGNRKYPFEEELQGTLSDIKKLTAYGLPICVLGDYNCSFSDNYYFTEASRKVILESFSDAGITLLTKDQSQCIDHIAISGSFIAGDEVEIKEWNQDKILSDHKGIIVTI